MFNHHKKETKDSFQKKKLFYPMTKAILVKAQSGKVLHMSMSFLTQDKLWTA